MGFKFICVCSGISAPSVAWKPRGHVPVAYAEIDPYACAVLAMRHGGGRPRFMPDPDLAKDEDERRSRVNAIKALERIEWGVVVRNEGDFVHMIDEPWIGDADVLVGGTPCQAFSLAGRRLSLSDDRGNLSLEFIRLANAIDDLRRAAGKPPLIVLWENVPGVFSSRDNAFGCFLAGLVGESEPLVPGRRKSWTDAGVVAGPDRVAAWRTLNAQHFRVPQRRRRVFVLARGGAGAWRVADALLPIIDSVCGHPPPSRQAGPDLAGGAEGGALGEGGGSDEPDGRGAGGEGVGGGPGSGRALGVPDLAGTVSAKWAKRTSGPAGDEFRNLVPAEPIPFDTTQITHPENRSRPEAGDPSPTLSRTGHPPAIAFELRQSRVCVYGDETGTLDTDGFSMAVLPPDPPLAFSCKDDGRDVGEVAPTLRAMNHDKSHPNAGGQVAVFVPEKAGPLTAAMGRRSGGPAMDGMDGGHIVAYAPEISAPLIATTPGGGVRTTEGVESAALVAHAIRLDNTGGNNDPVQEGLAHTLNTGKTPQAVAFSMRGRDGENQCEPEKDDVAPALRTGGGDSSKPFVAVQFQERGRPGGRSLETSEDLAYALTAPDGGGRAQERLVAIAEEPFAFKPSHFTRGKDGAPSSVSPTLTADADKGDQDPVVMTTAVRRLLPRECERLQGFPDDFTLVPWPGPTRTPEDLAESVAYLIAAGYGDNEARVLAETPDGPRYRVIGNSQAVTVMEELGLRIEWILACD